MNPYYVNTTVYGHRCGLTYQLLFCVRYKINLLKPSVKALMLSSRISMRSDYRGFLSMQYMIKAEDSQVCFVEYFVSFPVTLEFKSDIHY